MAKDIVIQLQRLGEETPHNQGRSTIYGAISEIERLRGLVGDLRPFMEGDVRMALDVVPPVYDGHDKDDCADCRWYESALVWKERMDAGELNV